MADLDIDGGCEIKTPTKSPKSLRSSRIKAKVEKKLSDEEKHQIFDTVYDDIYEVVLPNTLWGKPLQNCFSSTALCIAIACGFHFI